MSLSEVVRLANRAHAGQVDKLGREYVDAHLRPIAEAALQFGEDAVRAAWLHDVLEDTSVTSVELLEAGIDTPVVRAVESVTKRDGEPYGDLIRRSAADPLGRYVKLVDNAWNIACSPALATSDPDLAARMLSDKYLPARAVLLEATGLTLDSEDYVIVVERHQVHVHRLEGDDFGISLRPRAEGHGWRIEGATENEVYESESGLTFLTTSSGGDVDSYLTLPFATFPAIRTALRMADDRSVIEAVHDQIAGILANGVPTWAAAHGIRTETFTYANNDFWDRDA